MEPMFSLETVAAIARARRHSVGDLLHRSAQRYPDRLAVVDGDRRFTFAEFNDAVNSMASALMARGVVPGDRLALLSHNCWQFAALAFATAKLGVVLVPVNFMLGPDEIAYVLTHSGAVGIIAEDALAPTAEKALVASGTGGLRGWIALSAVPVAQGWDDIDTWWQGSSDGDGVSAPDVAIGDDDPLRLM